MGSQFASGKRSIAQCDRCDKRVKLTELREEVVKQRKTQVYVCQQCWDPDHPQLMLGTFPVDDPQAVRNPRPDRSYVTSGLLPDGYLGEGSRNIQWGWNPVGGTRAYEDGLTPNNLAVAVQLGTITVVTT